MFTCTACLRRCISSLTADVPRADFIPALHSSTWKASSTQILRSPSLASPDGSQRRSLRRPNLTFIRTAATLRGIRHRDHFRHGVQGLKNAESIEAIVRDRRRPSVRKQHREHRNDVAVEKNSQLSVTEQGKTKLQRRSEKEAAFLIDPLRLAQQTADHLRNDKFDKAYELVLASDRMGLQRGVPQGKVRNIVSWNHLIDWTMAKKEYAKAIKLYQDMKKRGHVPDSHTYILILRGLGNGVQTVTDGRSKKPTHFTRGPKGMTKSEGNAYLVKQAMDVYNSMFRPNSEVQVLTMHSNALINVLSRAGDMDALWGVTGRLPEKGHGSPDHWTYTTILNAMRQDLLIEMNKVTNGKLSERETVRRLHAVVDSAISDARQLWRDIIIRWRNVQLKMDEKMVAAMARLLLTSKKAAYIQDIFPLVRQTMGVSVDEKMIAAMRKDLRKNTDFVSGLTKAVSDLSVNEDDDEPAEEVSISRETDGESHEANAEVENEDKALEDASTASAGDLQVFDPVVMDVNTTTEHTTLYATPNQHTLSYLLEAATLLKRTAVGKAYWELLTSQTGLYRLVPDAGDIMEYLRLLRVSRSSQEVLQLLQEEREGEAANLLRRRGTCVIAMSTCVRDKNNPHVFDTASRLLDLMLDHASRTQNERDAEAYKKEQIREKNEAHERKDEFGQAIRPNDRNFSERGPLSAEALPLDPKVLQMYFDLAMFTTKGINKARPLSKLPSGDLDFVRDPLKNNTMRALHRLRPDVVNVRQLLNIALGSIQSSKGWSPKNRSLAERPEELLALLQTVVGAYDRILAVSFRLEEEGLGPLDNSVIAAANLQKAKMAEYVRRLKKALGEIVTEGDVRSVAERYGTRDDAERATAPELLPDEPAADSTEDPVLDPEEEWTIPDLRGDYPMPGSTEAVRLENDEKHKSWSTSGRLPAYTSREGQYQYHSQNYDQFQDHIGTSGKALTRRQQKYMNWIESKGNLKGPQLNLRKESRDPNSASAEPRAAFASTSTEENGVTQRVETDENRPREDRQKEAVSRFLTSASAAQPWQTSRSTRSAEGHQRENPGEPYSSRRGLSSPNSAGSDSGDGTIATNGFSGRDAEPRAKGRDRTALQRKMVRLGKTERGARDFKRGYRGSGRAERWSPSGRYDVGANPSAAAAGSG